MVRKKMGGTLELKQTDQGYEATASHARSGP